MNLSLDPVDAQLLDLLQSHFPLTERPFAALAEKVGVDGQDVLTRIAALKNGTRRIIRQISAIFDTRVLGYQSSLVAATIPREELNAAAKVVGPTQNLKPALASA